MPDAISPAVIVCGVATPSMMTFTTSPSDAPVPVNGTSTVVPSTASVPLMPPPAFSATLGAAGCVGATVSKIKLAVAGALGVPAELVATALTLIVPFPNVAISAAVNTTGTAVEPLPVTVLVIEAAPFVKVTAVLNPTVVAILTTPVAAVASALVAPSDTPVPNVNVTVLGGAVSMMTLSASLFGLSLPATSVSV